MDGFSTGFCAERAGGGTGGVLAIGGLLFGRGGTKITGGVLGEPGLNYLPQLTKVSNLEVDFWAEVGVALQESIWSWNTSIGWWWLVFFGAHLPLLPLPWTSSSSSSSSSSGTYSLPTHPEMLEDLPLGALGAAPCALALDDPLTRAGWGCCPSRSRWSASGSSHSWAYDCSTSDAPSIRDASVGVWFLRWFASWGPSPWYPLCEIHWAKWELTYSNSHNNCCTLARPT